MELCREYSKKLKERDERINRLAIEVINHWPGYSFDNIQSSVVMHIPIDNEGDRDMFLEPSVEVNKKVPWYTKVFMFIIALIVALVFYGTMFCLVYYLVNSFSKLGG